ncbi:anthranilate synthase component II [Alkalibacter mobilis]|uniref:anthranilate synthase component II n=1 Tax=Alkalibacter mobilis TaxID=2787712 RepID=UPI00189E06C0|nr:aminodeoxychorismate/anthranilate synthase component II [Alkalibacter mobilis]MBF7096992.1 aminodeoxychorismate/anthranilate synthase component II [Alkalibacter mobilis]
MILIIDNYDSFTYNLYQCIGEIDSDVRVVRNDEITIEDIIKLSPAHIVISPGPGYPKDAGISEEVIETLGKEVPILGVCLGHQAIAEVFRGRIVENEKMFHGKTSEVSHNGEDLFKGIESPSTVMRYHSLTVEEGSFSDEIEITAMTEKGEIMGLKHKLYPIYGVQFHPESIMTKDGKKMIENFLEM